MMARLIWLWLAALVLAGCGTDGALPTDPDTVQKPGVSRIDDCSMPSLTPAADTIKGYACYADQSIVAGQLVWTAKPIRHGQVELLRDADDALIAATATAADGSYAFTTAGLSMYNTYRVRVKSSGGLSTGESRVLGESSLPYAIAAPSFTPQPGQSRLQNLVVDTDKLAQAYNILDRIVDAQDYLLNVVAVGSVPPVTAIWYDGNLSGTYYCPPGYLGPECVRDDAIHVLGSAGDDDGFDDTVILHEYGHFVLTHFSRDDNIGGIHYLHQTDQDLRLSWSEGFATAFAAMVRRYLNEPDADTYIDSDGAGTLLYSYSLEGPGGGAYVLSPEVFAKGMGSEVAISVMLWDMVDDSGTTETFDAVNEETLFWDAIAAMGTLTANVTFQDLWEQWMGSSLVPIAEARSTFMLADAYETSDSAAAAPILSAGWANREQRTLHTVNDTDWAQVDLQAGVPCVIQTTNLLSGADTVLSLYQADGTTPLTDSTGNPLVNDDASAATLASQLTYTPPQSGRYVVKVERFWDVGEFARYGSYDLMLECPV